QHSGPRDLSKTTTTSTTPLLLRTPAKGVAFTIRCKRSIRSLADEAAIALRGLCCDLTATFGDHCDQSRRGRIRGARTRADQIASDLLEKSRGGGQRLLATVPETLRPGGPVSGRWWSARPTAGRRAVSLRDQNNQPLGGRGSRIAYAAASP